MKRLVVGCGYLGRRVAELWLRDGHDVFALTRTTANAAELQKLGLRPIVGDVMDPGTLADLPTVDTLLYAVGYDRKTAASQRDVYVDGLRNVLEVMTARAGRAIYVSSTSVYGQSAGEWVDETSATQPVRLNGQSCLEAEGVLWKLCPSANVLRLAGLYGPGRLLQRIESLSSRAPLDGNPDAYLNLIHVDDAARAVLAAERHGDPGQTHLVCDNRPIRRREYYEKLASLVGAPEPVYQDSSNREPADAGLGKRCLNRKMREELKVSLVFPDIDAGLPNAVGQST